MWFKVDDSMAFHPKIVAAGNAAIGLWVRAGAWSGDQHTGGTIPHGIGTSIGTRQQVNLLVKAGLWIPDSDSWRFHDWTDYNPSAHDMELQREHISSARSAAGTVGNHRRWHTNRGITDPTCEHCQERR